MRNIHEVLTEKQHELARIVKEVEALRLVLPLLSNVADSPPQLSPTPPNSKEAINAVIHDIPPIQAKRWP